MYFIDYRAPGGRRVRESIGPDKKVAEAVLGQRQREIIEGRYFERKKMPHISFSVFAQEYIDVYGSKLRSAKDRRSRVQCLCRIFGDCKLAEITTKAIEAYQTKSLETRKPATVNRALAALKHMLGKAVEWGYLSANPAKRVKLSKEENQRLRRLTDEEMEKLFGAAPEHLRPILLCALHTGMRKGEILSLTWDRVDFQNGFIRVTRTKSGKAREVPMTPELTETLRRIKMSRLKEGNVAKLSEARRTYVFRSSRDSEHFDCRKAFDTACRKAGLEDFHFHDLRHCFASWFMESGGDLYTLQGILGHAGPAMTQRYAHLSRGHNKRQIEAFGQFMGTKTDTSGRHGNVTY
jgi:integrase